MYSVGCRNLNLESALCSHPSRSKKTGICTKLGFSSLKAWPDPAEELRMDTSHTFRNSTTKRNEFFAKAGLPGAEGI